MTCFKHVASHSSTPMHIDYTSIHALWPLQRLAYFMWTQYKSLLTGELTPSACLQTLLTSKQPCMDTTRFTYEVTNPRLTAPSEVQGITTCYLPPTDSHYKSVQTTYWLSLQIRSSHLLTSSMACFKDSVSYDGVLIDVVYTPIHSLWPL